MRNRCAITLGALGAVLSLAAVCQATVVGFGQLGGNNSTVPSDLASRAVADGNGYSVANGTTPNVVVSWDADWDIHTSGHFGTLEDHTVGGGDWDNEGGIPRIGQLDSASHSIGFAVDAGYAVVLNSFDFAHTAETAGTTNWDVTLTDANSVVVWNESVEFEGGVTVTLSPNFTGDLGASYTLAFNRTDETYGSNGRHGLDNLSFNQVAVPEPASLALFGLAAIGMACAGRRR